MENMTFDSPVIAKQSYAGFWMRFVALIIDYIIIYVVQAFMVLPFLGLFGLAVMTDPTDFNEGASLVAASAMMGSIFILSLFTIAISWLYFALMESSQNQGTVGKIALGLKVTDLEGERISFLQATGRFFSKIISAMILYIGYIMAAFTEKKQALHDMIAGTLVLNKK